MTTIGGTGELKLLELVKPYLGAQAGGDDAAVLAEPLNSVRDGVSGFRSVQ